MTGNFLNDNKKGIISRTFEYIFNHIHNYNQIYLGFIQIYLENIQDLLSPSSKNIKLQEDIDKNLHLKGVKWVKVSNFEDSIKLLKEIEKNKVVEYTYMNEKSSRSHTIVMIKLETIMKDINIKKAADLKNSAYVTYSYLYLVDLAGSERLKKSQITSKRLNETKKINYSLLILGNCINALTGDSQVHVSYRDSVLTRILQESLGGNSKTALIVCISPSMHNSEETYSSLNFALRARKVENRPTVNTKIDYRNYVYQLEEKYNKLSQEYEKLSNSCFNVGFKLDLFQIESFNLYFYTNDFSNVYFLNPNYDIYYLICYKNYHT